MFFFMFTSSSFSPSRSIGLIRFGHRAAKLMVIFIRHFHIVNVRGSVVAQQQTHQQPCQCIESEVTSTVWTFSVDLRFQEPAPIPCKCSANQVQYLFDILTSLRVWSCCACVGCRGGPPTACLRGPVCRGCPCRDPQGCSTAQAVWLSGRAPTLCVVVVGGLENRLECDVIVFVFACRACFSYTHCRLPAKILAFMLVSPQLKANNCSSTFARITFKIDRTRIVGVQWEDFCSSLHWINAQNLRLFQ